VILKDVSSPSGPVVVARQELPYSFDVISKSRTREPAYNQPSPALSPKIRRRRKFFGPATTITAQLEAGSHEEDIEIQPQREQLAEGIPACDQTGQRVTDHVISILEPEQQSSSDIQCFVIPCPPIPRSPLSGSTWIVLRAGQR
jgi:hypothetical protein